MRKVDCKRLVLAMLFAIGIVATSASRSSSASQQPDVQVPSYSMKFGAFVARFDPGGTFTLEGVGWPRLTGNWKSKGDEIELSMSGGPEGCGGPGRYRLRLDGNHVSFDLNKAVAEMKTVDAETLAKMERLLKQLDLPNAKRKSNEEKPECCDKVYSYVIVKLDRRQYHTSNLNLGISQTSNYKRLLSIFDETVSKNKTILMNKAAELKIKNAKALFVWVTDTNDRIVWEGTFSKQGESNFFEGEWKNNEAQTIVKDKVEVLLSGQTVRIMGNGTDRIGLPKEFEGKWNNYQPGIISKPILRNEINWTARFE